MNGLKPTSIKTNGRFSGKSTTGSTPVTHEIIGRSGPNLIGTSIVFDGRNRVSDRGIKLSSLFKNLDIKSSNSSGVVVALIKSLFNACIEVLAPPNTGIPLNVYNGVFNMIECIVSRCINDGRIYNEDEYMIIVSLHYLYNKAGVQNPPDDNDAFLAVYDFSNRINSKTE